MAKTRSQKRRIGIRDRLGRLTYRGARRLLADGEEGMARLRQGDSSRSICRAMSIWAVICCASTYPIRNWLTD